MLDAEGMREYENAIRILSTPCYEARPDHEAMEGGHLTLLPWMTEALSRGQMFMVVPDHPPSHKRGGDKSSPPGETTTLLIDGKPVGEGVADATGRWTIRRTTRRGGEGAASGVETRQSAPVPRMPLRHQNPSGCSTWGNSWVGPGPAIGKRCL